MNDFRDPGFGATLKDAYDAVPLAEAGRRVRRAVWWMLAGVGVSLGTVFAGMVVGTLTGASWGPTMQAVDIASGVVGILLTLIITLQWWRATAPIEGVPHERDEPRTRNSVRVASVAFIVLGIAGIFVNAGLRQNQGFTPGQAASFTQMFPPTLIAFLVITFIVSAVYYTCIARHLRWMSSLLPSEQRVPLADVCVWLVPLLCTVGILACFTGPIAGTVLVYILCFIVSARAMNAPGIAPLDEHDEHAGSAP